MVEKITEDHCRKILLQENSSFILESYKVEPLVQESLGGLIGLHYILTIQYTSRTTNTMQQTLQLFVKTLNDHNKLMYEVSKNLLFFEKEETLLMKLLPEYEKVGINVAFAPRAYLCENNAVILENLILSGFKLYPKTEYLDIKHCYACIDTIAQFHASSLLFEICKSKSSGVKYNLTDQYSNILEDLIFSGGDTYGTKYVQKSVEGLIALAELEFGDDTTLEELKNIFGSMESSDYDELCCVLLHGDLWNNNFLHKYENDAIVESKLIDYQTIKYGPPSLDVLQFIYSNTNKMFRKKYFNDLLLYYHQKLSEIFHDRALDIDEYLPREEFMKTCDTFALQIKLQSAIDRCLTAIPDCVLEKTMHDEEKINDFIFINRPKYLVEFYKNIPSYREFVSEDLRELRDMISTNTENEF